jgi:pterin-4a-carbinolamine dehydratase
MSTRAPLERAEVVGWCASHSPFALSDDGHLVAYFPIGYDAAIAVLRATQPLVASIDHHPIATVEFGGLRVECWTHDRGAVTGLDLQLCAAIGEAVSQLADPTTPSSA